MEIDDNDTEAKTGRGLNELDGAIEAAASALYRQMEVLDPSGEGPWETLDPADRAFYEHTIRGLVTCEGEVCIALGNLAAARNDRVNRRRRT